MSLSIVVAVAQNGVIGNANDLPWRLPDDLKRFKSLTLGKPIVMGRKTYDSIGRPLPGRTNIVVSRQSGLRIEGCVVVNSVAAAIAAAGSAAEIMLIGGAELYREALSAVNTIYLTRVSCQCRRGHFFPGAGFAMAGNHRIQPSGRRTACLCVHFCKPSQSWRAVMTLKFDCSKCPGYCCSHSRIAVSDYDIERLAKHFNLSVADAKKRFTYHYKTKDADEQILRHQRDHIYKTVCRFFDTDERRCTIYEARPNVCRKYPYGNKCGYYDFLKFEREHQDDQEFIPSA